MPASEGRRVRRSKNRRSTLPLRLGVRDLGFLCEEGRNGEIEFLPQREAKGDRGGSPAAMGLGMRDRGLVSLDALAVDGLGLHGVKVSARGDAENAESGTGTRGGSPAATAVRSYGVGFRDRYPTVDESGGHANVVFVREARVGLPDCSGWVRRGCLRCVLVGRQVFVVFGVAVI